MSNRHLEDVSNMHSKSLHLLNIYLTSDRKRPIDVLQMSKHS